MMSLWDALRMNMMISYQELVRTFPNDALCQVGEWIYNEGKSLAKHPEYERFRELHAQFHQCAGSIVSLHQKGHFMEALATVKNELMPLSEEVGLSLGELLEASQH
ncbi:CZB domain-containing protein [Kluyvera sichuanensis]|uniref:CZB domain-containing protein n=1 Tax=Kluyvera sichuanensis TaxID=2725494 RepID=UPI0039F5FC8E